MYIILTQEHIYSCAIDFENREGFITCDDKLAKITLNGDVRIIKEQKINEPVYSCRRLHYLDKIALVRANRIEVLKSSTWDKSSEIPLQIKSQLRETNLQYAKEDRFPLLIDGDSIVLLDPELKKIDKKYQSTFIVGSTVTSMCVGRDLSIIVLIFILKSQSYLSIVNTNEKTKQPLERKVIKAGAKMEFVAAEITTETNLLILAINRIAMGMIEMAAYDIQDSSLRVRVASLLINDQELSSCKMMRKIKGYDIFMTCSPRSLVIIALKGSQFHPLQKLSNICETEITGLSYSGSYLAIICSDLAKQLIVVQFNVDSYSSLVIKEKSSLSDVDSNIYASFSHSRLFKMVTFEDLGMHLHF